MSPFLTVRLAMPMLAMGNHDDPAWLLWCDQMTAAGYHSLEDGHVLSSVAMCNNPATDVSYVWPAGQLALTPAVEL